MTAEQAPSIIQPGATVRLMSPPRDEVVVASVDRVRNMFTDHRGDRWSMAGDWELVREPLVTTPSTNSSPLKFMAPGHFCPDACGIEDFGEADYWRGRVIRGFFRLMRLWPKPRARPVSTRGH